MVWEDGSPHGRSTKEEKKWKGVQIIGKQGEGIHISDLTYISVMIPSSHELYDVNIMGQQALELLGIDGREHKHIFSHMIDGVAGVEEGTLIVQGDQSLAGMDWEAFPSWEKLHICSSITKVVLDKEHVKEQRLA